MDSIASTITRMIKQSAVISAALLLFECSSILSITIGSDTAVNAFNTLQVLNTGDRIAGFAGINAGFDLFDENTSATFDCVFKVEGNVAFNGGTLVLNEDLVLREDAIIPSLGHIEGSSHVVDLSYKTRLIPTNPPLSSCVVSLLTTATQLSQINACSWSYDSRFILIGMSGSTLTPELRVYEFDGTTLTLRASHAFANVSIIDARWHPSAYFFAVGFVSSANPDFQVFSFNPSTFTITQTDSDEMSGSINAVAWHPSGDYVVTGGDNTAQEIVLYPVSAGVLNKPGRLVVNLAPDRAVINEALDWDITGSYLAVGTAVNGIAPTLLVYTFDTSPGLSLTLNASVNIARVNSVSWNPALPSILATGLETTSPLLRIYQHDATAGTLTQIVGVATNLTTPVRRVDWDSQGVCLGLVKDVSGSGGEFRTYKYYPTIPTLTLISDINSADSAFALAWRPSEGYVATGAPGATNPLNMYQSRPIPPHWRWNNVRVQLNSDVTIRDSLIRILGRTSLLGQGNTLTLAETTTILVDPGASLLLDNMQLQGTGVRFMQGADTLSTVTFRDVQMLLESNYSFTTGKVDIIRDLKLVGAQRVFAYRSTQTCNVTNNSRLIVDENVTFSVDSTALNPFALQDAARLVLAGGTFVSTATAGLQFARGVIDIERESLISGRTSAGPTAITIGTGVAANNTVIHVAPAAQLQVDGRLIVNNS